VVNKIINYIHADITCNFVRKYFRSQYKYENAHVNDQGVACTDTFEAQMQSYVEQGPRYVHPVRAFSWCQADSSSQPTMDTVTIAVLSFQFVLFKFHLSSGTPRYTHEITKLVQL
jgi:hypothetical protein